MILAQSTGINQAIWRTTLMRLPYGAEHMSDSVFSQQKTLADTFTRVMLLPVKAELRSATGSADKK